MTKTSEILRILQRIEAERRRHNDAMDAIAVELSAMLPANDVGPAAIIDWRKEIKNWGHHGKGRKNGR